MMRLRQVALVASRLDPVKADLQAILGIDSDFRDEGVAAFGLENSVMALDDTYLEVVAPVTENTTAGRLLERRGGDGGYMVIVQVDDLEPFARRATELGVRKVWEVALPDASAIHLHPRDIGGAIVSFDQMTPPESWRWAGPGWESRKARLVNSIVAVELQAMDVQGMAERWGQVFEREVRQADDYLYLQLERGVIRFVADTNGRGDGVCGLDIQTDKAEQVLQIARDRALTVSGDMVTVCGTKLRFLA
jgi:hypothetical protein